MAIDNSHFNEKVKLRLKAIAEIPKDEVSILECYAGKGLLYAEVKNTLLKNCILFQSKKKKAKIILRFVETI